MKTFCSKFVALALAIGLIGIFNSVASPAFALDVQKCQKELSDNSFTRGKPSPFLASIGPTNGDGSIYFKKDGTHITAGVVVIACSKVNGGAVYAYLESDKTKVFRMTFLDPPGMESSEQGTSIQTGGYWDLDTEALDMPSGTYRIAMGAFVDEFGQDSGFRETLYTNGEPIRYVLSRTKNPTTTSSTTVLPPLSNRPEILDDQLVGVVWNSKSAKIYYTVTVRCSKVCGTLPTGFAARLCEEGTSFNSSTCISSIRPHQIGKARSTKLGVVNTFTNTFSVSKKATGKKYRVYSYVPTGKKQYQTLGMDTIVWNGKSWFKNAPSPLDVPTNSSAPGVTATTIADTSPSTTTNVASSAALAVTSDLISGKTSLTVKGNGAAVKIEVSIKCSGQCIKLPNSILGRLCKVGTSYTDASCTSIITLYPIGTTATISTFRGNTMFGTSPTGADYQPFFSMTATGISGTTRLSGTSRVTWIK